jgi:hypothetical protein
MKRKETFIVLLSIAIVFIAGLFALGYLNSYFGWYGYEKWKYRVSTGSIEESKRRGVFVRELHFEIDSFPGTIENFHAYIEKGFHYGHQSEDQTTPLLGSKYPYQLSFNFQETSKLRIYITEAELSKFDSSNINRGYLKSPDIKDTIRFYLIGGNKSSGIIKVWDQ